MPAAVRPDCISMPAVRPPAAALLLLCCLLACVSLAGAVLPPCPPLFSDGVAVVQFDCLWGSKQEVPAKRVTIMAPRDVGDLPALGLEPDADPGAPADFSITLKRVVLRGMTLAPASGAGGLPRLLPLGLFAAVPRNISFYDVRIVVTEDVFQEYLAFFRQQLRTSRDAAGTGPSIHTDNSSVLNVPYWSDNSTEVFSLTFVSGPCKLRGADEVPWADSLQRFPSIPGCNLRTATNKNLAAILLRDAANATRQPLLVRVVANVTLGPGITQSIPIRRPVVLLGMVSAPTSVDLGMVVNQLNVTLPLGKMTWQSLVLENLAPGDAISSTVAPPFSTTVSSNVWAMYCNRSASSCLNLNNVTLVVPTQEELNYQVFMYTMFNSPAPALRELTDFYRADLSTQVIQFVPGPSNDTLTIIRLLSKGWDFWYVAITLRPFVAVKRPMPRQALVMQRYRAGALVYALQDCGGFATALASKSTSTRTRVWTLIKNVSIADAGGLQCPWPDGNITYPTQLLGAVVHTFGPSARVHDNGVVASPLSPEAIVLGHADADTRRNGAASSGDSAPPADPYLPYDVGGMQAGAGAEAPPYAELYALNFGYVPSLFQLPVDAHDKFLQINNVTLKQLPQMAPSRSLRGRRLLQSSGASPIGTWTILLWPIRRTMYGVPVTISDSQLLIPQPEWDAVANEARQAPSFAFQLQGQAGGLTFTGVSLLDNNTMRVGAFQGPGVAGTNLWLLPDPEAARMSGYTWPAELFAEPHSGTQGGSTSSAALRAGIGVAVAVLGLLAVVLIVVALRRRRRRTAASIAVAEGDKAEPQGPAAGVLQQQKPSNGAAPCSAAKSAAAVAGVADADVVCSDKGTPLVKAAVAAGAAAAVLKSSNRRQPSSGSKPSGSGASRPLPAAERRSDSGSGGPADVQQAGSEAPEGRPSSDMQQTIADGLERWNTAVSTTTMQLMQRRMQNSTALYGQPTSGSGSGSQMRLKPQQQQEPSCSPDPLLESEAAVASSASGTDQGLQLHSLIGTGSFGSVYLASWRGKRVAVKVMHLQSNALTDGDQSGRASRDYTQEQQQERLQRQRERPSPPHMAIMEAVVSSTMSHPNVVQVYTYLLSPLMVQPGVQSGSQPSVREQRQLEGDSQSGGVFGWQLRLIMELCDQGTLRDALDKRRLPRLPGTSFPHPCVVFSLAHDVAAAMLHLHSEGIVHGDLKAGNVLLTANPSPCANDGCSDPSAGSAEVWIAAGSQPLSAKVADFGMAMPLGPKDTHATMLARGTPTHMSPEIFLSGHVSKASDVYAYGILLYELISGLRAYAGVAIPLLPHEVAVQGLRPEWPRKMPADFDGLRRLAEACWQQKPSDRPAFDAVLRTLERSCAAPSPPPSPPQQQQQQQPGQGQGQSPSKQQQQQDAPPGADSSQGPTQGAVVFNPFMIDRKASKAEPLSWSEISYGGSRHDGGWS